MLDPDTLQRKALTEVQGLLGRLMKGRVELQPRDRDTDWDGFLKRHVHLQHITAWHQFNEVQIGVDGSGQVLYFRDPRRFVDAVYSDLEPAEVLAICATAGLVGKRVEDIELPSDGDPMLTVTLRQRHHRLPAEVEYTINRGKRQLAALRVLKGAA
jgi:hypothetical protein